MSPKVGFGVQPDGDDAALRLREFLWSDRPFPASTFAVSGYCSSSHRHDALKNVDLRSEVKVDTLDHTEW